MDSASAIKALRVELNVVRQEVGGLRDRLDKKDQIIAEKGKELTALYADLLAKDRTIDKLKSRVRQLAGNNEHLEEVLGRRDQEIGKLRRELGMVSSKCGYEEAMLARFQTRIEALTQTNKELNERLAVLNSQ